MVLGDVWECAAMLRAGLPSALVHGLRSVRDRRPRKGPGGDSGHCGGLEGGETSGGRKCISDALASHSE